MGIWMKAIRKIILLLVLILFMVGARYVIYNIMYPADYKEYVIACSEEYGVDPYLLLAVINTESSFQEDAVSNKGAAGLMQLTESTAQWVADKMGSDDYKQTDLYDPKTNIMMGAWYLADLQDQFSSTELALAAYNAGRGKVTEWITDTVISEDGSNIEKIPYPETELYIQKVLFHQKVYQLLYRNLG